MNTPIHDFVTRYKDLRPARFHMPGHKGRGPLGCEALDLTEIPGADSLYEAAGIIAQSEANASRLFGCPSFYSTEGSSQCIKAMLLLAMQSCHSERSEESDSSAAHRTATKDGGRGFLTAFGMTKSKGFRVLAARNVHKAFLSAAALLDLEVLWLPGSEGSYLSAELTPETLAAALEESGAQAVYLTCPDYLGFLPDLKPLAEACHAHGALLLVDNAHGAYLRFLSPSRHPMDLGADLCCDSAHKTLPVLTGGAYLHIKASEDEPACRDGSQPSAPSDEASGDKPACRDGSQPSAPSEEASGDGRDGFLASLGMTERGSRAVRDGSQPSAPSDEASGDGGDGFLASLGMTEQGSRAVRDGSQPSAPSDEASGDGGDGFLASLGMTEQGSRAVRDALALFGSTSPSYLILQSLDLANPYMEALPEKLAAFLPRAEALKARLRAEGWNVVGDEPLKLTISCHSEPGEESVSRTAGTLGGAGPSAPLCSARDDRSELPHLPAPPAPMTALAAALEREGIFCEFADPDYIVFMLSPEHTEAELARLETALQKALSCRDGTLPSAVCPALPRTDAARPRPKPERFCSIREAMLSPAVTIPAAESLGRVLARPGVSCPPAVPILMPGERIDEAAAEALARSGIRTVAVLP